MGARIEAKKCIGCGICVEVCPNEALEIIDGCSVLVRRDDCESCGICAELCEQQAIMVEGEAGTGDETI